MAPTPRRTHLRLVPSTSEQLCPTQWFCGHCGTPAADVPAPVARVCPHCEMGLLLEARTDVMPRPGEPFLIADGALAVQALSAAAEKLLAVAEHDVVNKPVTALLTPADAEASGTREFATTIMLAARGDAEPHRLTVRPANVFGVRMPLRVGACGPPRAALLVLE